LDAAAPPPSPPAAVAAAAAAPTDFYGRNDRERELCRKASSPDWLYLGVGAASIVGGIVADTNTKWASSVAERTLGPVTLGLTWGFALGAIYPSLPHCEPTWIRDGAREGDVRQVWPYALSMALLASLTAPLIMGVEQGFNFNPEMKVPERQARIFVAGGSAFLGALIPYVLPPKTWRAARELERLRAAPLESGVFIGWSGRF